MKETRMVEMQRIAVLYVEDDEATRREVAECLVMEAETVYTAANGREGLELFREHRPDMVITDVQMPEMDGLEMVREIRKIDGDVPVAVTTAFSESEYIVEAIRSGVDKYIMKPVDIEELLAVVEKSTRVRKLLEQLAGELEEAGASGASGPEWFKERAERIRSALEGK